MFANWHERSQALQQAAAYFQKAKKAVILTGAGISTSSGIPDFRSTESSIWKRFDPREVASLSAFRYNPENFFKWIRTLVIEIEEAYPNPAHMALAQLEKSGHILSIITQNVDGLHQRAGSQAVIEVHGSFRTATCIRCFHQFSTDGLIEPFIETGIIPYCPDCGGNLKPDVILFEEQLPYLPWTRAQEACKACDLMVVIGSSLEVMPVAGLPFLALERAVPLIIFNHTETYLDVRAQMCFKEDVAHILPLIVTEALGKET